MTASLKMLGLVLCAALIGGGSATEHHLFCHSHDDLGWLKTIAEYSQDTEKIFRTTIEGLEACKATEARLKRKFSYSEVGFLKIFLQKDAAAGGKAVERLQALTKKGQVEWVNGGISQADSACSSFEDIATNYFSGQRYIKKHFGVTSKVAWQLDPFGHSSTLMAMAHLYGMRHAFFVRITDAIKYFWAARKQLQFVWKLPNGAEMISHLQQGYGSPSALGCDTDCNPLYFNQIGYRIAVKINDLMFRRDNFFFVGSDFHWTKSDTRFPFVDHALSRNADTRYSTPSEYTKAFESQNPKTSLPIFRGDFFAYTSGVPFFGDTWTGYFTTKPLLKYRIRRVQKLLREFKSKFALLLFKGLAQNKASISEKLIDLSEEVSVFLHHDAITGTSIERVDDDYFQRMAAIEKSLLELVPLMAPESSSVNADDGSEAPKYEFCDLAEVVAGTQDTCGHFQAYLQGQKVIVAVMQTLNHRSDDIRSFVIPDAGPEFKCEVHNSKGELIPSITFCGLRKGICEVYISAPFIEVSSSRDPYWYLQKVAKTETSQTSTITQLTSQETQLDVGNYRFYLTDSHIRYQEKSQVSNGPDDHWYIGFQVIDSGASGHYILKYNSKSQFEDYGRFESAEVSQQGAFSVLHIKGDKVEVRILSVSGISSLKVQSLVKATRDFEKGIDLVLSVGHSAIKNLNKKMIADSNGLFELERIPGWTREESVFPVTAHARIEPANGAPGMVVLNDRPQGVFADVTGLRFYLQRSAKNQDHKGNPEILRVRENIFVEHTIMTVSAEIPWDQFWRFRSHYDTNQQAIYLTKNSIIRSEESSRAFLIGKELPFVRFNVEFVDGKKGLVRVWNISPRDEADLPLRDILTGHFKKVQFSVVENDFVFGPIETAKPVPERVVLKPFEAITVAFGDLAL